MEIRELFDTIASGESQALITALETDPLLINVVSEDGLSVFEALMKAGYTRTAAHIVELPEFDIDHVGHNPLRIAVAVGSLDIAHTLLQKGSTPNYQPEGMASVLLLCLENEYFELAEFMVAQGAEVDIRNEHGWTPLMWASMKGRREAVDFLLRHGANIHACNNEGWNAVTGAFFKRRKDIVDLLLEKNAVFGAKYAEAALIAAYQKGNVDVVSYLLKDLLVNPNVADESSVSLLAKAVVNADWQLVTLLLEKGADVNEMDAKGIPLLALVSKNGNDEIIRKFLAEGADINLRSEGGESAVYLAAKHNQIESVRLLLNQGADINVQNAEGLTPLMIAANRGYLAMAELLVQQGANIELLSKNGNTAKKVALLNAPRTRQKHLAEGAHKAIAEELTLPGHHIDS